MAPLAFRVRRQATTSAITSDSASEAVTGVKAAEGDGTEKLALVSGEGKTEIPWAYFAGELPVCDG